jgi:hypothetical protein
MTSSHHTRHTNTHHRYFLNGSSTHSLADVSSKDLSGSNVAQFADEFFAGNIKPQLKSIGEAVSTDKQEKAGAAVIEVGTVVGR